MATSERLGRSSAAPVHGLGELLGGVAAPEGVGGEAEEEEDDGDDDVLERGGVVEGEDDGVRDDGCGGENEEEWSERIAGDAIGDFCVGRFAAEREDCGGTEPIENPADEDCAAGEIGELAGTPSGTCATTPRCRRRPRSRARATWPRRPGCPLAADRQHVGGVQPPARARLDADEQRLRALGR